MQDALEKFTTTVNPMKLVIGTDSEYEDEIEMFLDRASESMVEEDLVEILREIFKEMFNLKDDSGYINDYVCIAHEYLRLCGNQTLS